MMTKDTNNQESEREYLRLSTETILPSWLSDELPEHDKVVVIDFDENSSTFHLNGRKETFESLEKAYHFVKNKLNAEPSFDESVDGHGGSLHGGMFFCEGEEGSNSAPLLLSFSSHDRLALLKRTYGYWVEITYPSYKASPGDWVTCYNWLRDHPAFWTKQEEGKTFSWNTDNGLGHLWSSVDHDKNGQPSVAVEHGCHVAPEYKFHYHDLRLDSYGSSFEQAYINLAAKVDKFFLPSGEERKNVKYKKSKLELRLEKIASNLDS